MNDIGKLFYNSGITTQSFTWRIENFQSYLSQRSNTYLLSPAFSTLHSGNTKQWRIKLQLRNSVQGLENYSSVFLQYFGEDEVVMSVAFYVDNGLMRFLITDRSLKNQLFSPQSACYGFNDFLNHKDYSSRRNQTLVIGCEISFDQKTLNSIPKAIKASTNKSTNLEENDLKSDFQDDLDKLFESGILGDVTIRIGEKKKTLHKAILANRSDVFRAMFQHDMKEKEQNVVDIVDIKLEVAMEMFRYMYTGKVKDIEKIAVNELLGAAEKYAIAGLKILCQETLSDKLNFDNALEYLTLASMYNSIDLKKKVIDFIVKYLNKFVDKPEFKSLDQSILCELFSIVAEKKY